MVTNTAVSVELELLEKHFPDKPLLNKKEVCRILGCSYVTLRTKTIPWDRNGKISKNALAKWLSK